MLDQLLEKVGIKKDDLTADEAETLKQWATQLETRQMNLHDVESYVNSMITSVEKELFERPQTLVDVLFRKKRHAHLMARLNNYMLLRDLLSSPARARAKIEEQISRFKKPA